MKGKKPIAVVVLALFGAVVAAHAEEKEEAQKILNKRLLELEKEKLDQIQPYFDVVGITGEGYTTYMEQRWENDKERYRQLGFDMAEIDKVYAKKKIDLEKDITKAKRDEEIEI